MDELKPCPVPWCERVNKPEVYNPAPEGCCVVCPDCGLETHAFATEAEAIAAWNRRPTPEPALGLVDRVAGAIRDATEDRHFDYPADARAAIAAMGSPVDEIVAWLLSGEAFALTDREIADQIEAKWGRK